MCIRDRLEDHGGFPPEFLHFRFGNMGKVHRHVVNGKTAGFGFFQIIEAPEKRSLSRASRAENGNNIAFFYGEIDIF